MEPRRLLARVRSLLRRAENEARKEPGADAVAGGLRIDVKSRQAWLGQQALDLTDAEFDLLRYLTEHPGEQLTREQLARDVCEVHYDGLDRTIDVRIARLRAKLKDDPKRPRWFKSIRGVGYMFVPQGEE